LFGGEATVEAIAARIDAGGVAPAERPVPRLPRTGGVQHTLSRREMQIADLVGEGRTNQQIATALDLSPKTVETYLARIFKKLGIGSRTQIALLVGRAGAPVTLAP
ncbi:helix-turn-helix transcriptional regulator, partial [Actinocorallia aurantiaca]